MDRRRPEGRADPEPLREEVVRTRARRIHFACEGSAPWKEAIIARAWLISDAEHAPDIIVCSGSTVAEMTARFPHAGIVRVIAPGETASHGADVIVFDPTAAEFIESCERALLASRARNLTGEHVVDILECSDDALFVLDWDERVTYQNRQALAFVARLEGGDGDIMGEGLEPHLPRDLVSRSMPIVRRVLREADPRRAEIYVKALAAWMEASVYFIPAGVAIYLRDVTARKRAEAIAATSLVQALAEELGVALTTDRIERAVDRLQRAASGGEA